MPDTNNIKQITKSLKGATTVTGDNQQLQLQQKPPYVFKMPIIKVFNVGALGISLGSANLAPTFFTNVLQAKAAAGQKSSGLNIISELGPKEIIGRMKGILRSSIWIATKKGVIMEGTFYMQSIVKNYYKGKYEQSGTTCHYTTAQEGVVNGMVALIGATCEKGATVKDINYNIRKANEWPITFKGTTAEIRKWEHLGLSNHIGRATIRLILLSRVKQCRDNIETYLSGYPFAASVIAASSASMIKNAAGQPFAIGNAEKLRVAATQQSVKNIPSIWTAMYLVWCRSGFAGFTAGMMWKVAGDGAIILAYIKTTDIVEQIASKAANHRFFQNTGFVMPVEGYSNDRETPRMTNSKAGD